MRLSFNTDEFELANLLEAEATTGSCSSDDDCSTVVDSVAEEIHPKTKRRRAQFAFGVIVLVLAAILFLGIVRVFQSYMFR
jgi:hypothetical protein